MQQVWKSSPWQSMDVRAVLNRLIHKSLLFAANDGRHYSMLRLIHQFAADLPITDAA